MRPLQTKLAYDQIAVVTKRVGLKVGNVQVGKSGEQVTIGRSHLVGTIGNLSAGQLQARRADLERRERGFQVPMFLCVHVGRTVASRDRRRSASAVPVMASPFATVQPDPLRSRVPLMCCACRATRRAGVLRVAAYAWEAECEPRSSAPCDDVSGECRA